MARPLTRLGTPPGLRLLAILLALASTGCSSLLHRARTDRRWLDPATGRASPLPGPKLAALPRKHGTTFNASIEGEPIRVAVFGDTQGNRNMAHIVAEAIREERPDLVVFTGDALDACPLGLMPDFGVVSYAIPLWPQYLRGRPEVSLFSVVPFPAVLHDTFFWPLWKPYDPDGYNAFLRATGKLRLEDRVPLLFVPGNHDIYHDRDREQLAQLFGSPDGTAGDDPERLWFSFDTRGVRWIVLNTGTDLLFDENPIAPGGEQLSWLDRTLAEAEERGLRVVVCMHRPPYGSCRDNPPSPALNRDVVAGALDRHRVALVLSGHQHAYERLERPGKDDETVTYVVTGGGGGCFDDDYDPGTRDPRSVAFIPEVHHFVMLEIDARTIRGRFVPVGECPADASDEFEIGPRQETRVAGR
jgi:3',5'-cyclic AMP phosphodiesterase CpdA